MGGSSAWKALKGKTEVFSVCPQRVQDYPAVFDHDLARAFWNGRRPIPSSSQPRREIW